jgi:hypothetical protein
MIMQQDCRMASTHAEAAETINADPKTVYDIVADLPGMGRLSPENVGGKWVGGADGPTVGARFRGNNRAGWRRWSTTAKVTAAEPGKRFAFHVSVGPFAVADWSYEFEPAGSGTTVTEKWDERRPGWMKTLSGPVMGVYDRGEHNGNGMEVTLAALKKAAESGS